MPSLTDDLTPDAMKHASPVNGMANLPKFLVLPFRMVDIKWVDEGWIYSLEEKMIHGFETHFGIDFGAARGTPVYAASDGIAIASYHQAFAGEWKNKRVGFGLGNFVQIWHPAQKLFSLYAHLEKVSDNIPYFEPEFRLTEDGETWEPVIVYQPISKTQIRALPVKKGDLIGCVGDSGLSWGYEESSQVRLSPVTFISWDKVHLHFEIYDRDENGKKKRRLDPFGLYSDYTQYMDPAKKVFRFGSNSLWLMDNGKKPQPLYAR